MTSTSKSTTVEKEGYLWWWGKRNAVKQKTWQWKYAVLKRCSGYKCNACLEYYDTYDAFLTHSNPKIIDFDTVKYVGNFESPKKEFAFIAFICDQQLQMATKTEMERADWIESLNKFLHKQMCSNNTSSHQPYMDRAVESSAAESKSTAYLVKFKECTLGPGFLSVKVDYLMNVGAKKVTVSTIGSKEQARTTVCAWWSLETIKSYKSRPSDNPSMKLLEIETGRRSSTGKGMFYFLTRFAEQIVEQIRLNAKRLYFVRMGSQDSFNVEYGSSPEASSSRYSTSPRLASVRSNKPPAIPFHEYDRQPDENGDTFANYIRHENDYIHVLTKQETVEKSRRYNSRKGFRPSADRESTSADDDHPSYLDVLEEGAVSADNDHSAYIEVLPDDEPLDQSRGRSRDPDETDQEIYIEVLGDGEKPQENSENVRENFTYEETHHQTTTNTRYELRHDLRQDNNIGRESLSSVGSSRWQSLTSQTSSVDYSSISSENEVFRERDSSFTSDVFQEEPTKYENSSPPISKNNNNETKSVESHNPDQTNNLKEENELFQQYSSQEVSQNPNNHFGESGHLEAIQLVNQDKTTVASSREELENPTKERRKGDLNTRSWHSDTGSDVADTSEILDDSSNTSLESDGENVRDSQDLSEEENADSEMELRRNSDTNLRDSSPRSSFCDSGPPKERIRSYTMNDLCEKYNETVLQDVLQHMTNPQGFRAQNHHSPLKQKISGEGIRGSGNDFEDKIAAQLMNPIAASKASQPKTCGRHSHPEIKYVCSECGWHKISRKKSVWNRTKSVKYCDRCNHVIHKRSSTKQSSKQKSPKSPKKEKSPSILHRFKQTIKGPSQNGDDNETIRTEWTPKEHPEPSFLKKLNTHIPTHTVAHDSSRISLGIGPSPKQALQAVSIGGDNRTLSRNPPPSENTAPSGGRAPLVSSLSEGSASVAPNSRPEIERVSVGHNMLSKTVSSPVCVTRAEITSDLLTVEAPTSDVISQRRNSANTLETVKEVEDLNDDAKNDFPGSCPDMPPAIPPRTREEPPPLPPRRSPVTRSDSTRIIRAQTDPTNSLSAQAPGSPMLHEKHRVSRTLTDPGNKNDVTNENIRNAVSLGNLVEDKHESKTGTNTTLIKVMSLSLEDDLKTEDPPPPPLPPRRGSGQAPLSPRRGVGKNSSINYPL